MIKLRKLLKISFSSIRSYLKGKYSSRKYGVEFSADSFLGYYGIIFGIKTEGKMIDEIRESSEGKVFYDIGAYLGLYSCIMADKSSHVLSFEPNPISVKLLESNLVSNSFSNFEIFELAVSDYSGVASFETGIEPSISSLSKAGDLSVEVTSIDEFFRERDVPPPEIVKIDTEGQELEVIEGMDETIDKHSPEIYCEVHEGNTEEIKEVLSHQYKEVEVIDKRFKGNLFLKAQ